MHQQFFKTEVFFINFNDSTTSFLAKGRGLLVVWVWRGQNTMISNISLASVMSQAALQYSIGVSIGFKNHKKGERKNPNNKKNKTNTKPTKNPTNKQQKPNQKDSPKKEQRWSFTQQSFGLYKDVLASANTGISMDPSFKRPTCKKA